MNRKVRNNLLALGMSLIPLAFGALPVFAQGWSPITDPFGNVTGICNLLQTIVDVLFGLAIALATVFLIIGGYQYMTSGGDKMQVEAARGRITAAVTGLIIALGAYFIIRVLIGLLSLSIPGCRELAT